MASSTVSIGRRKASSSPPISRKIAGMITRMRGRTRSETSAPRPEKTSMPVIRTEAETVGLPSAITKWAMSPTSTMM